MIDEIIGMLEENRDLEQAEKMSAYMQNRFEFAGIPKPKLKELMKPFIKDTSKKPLDWNLIFGLWECKLREAQYVALEYLQKHQNIYLRRQSETIFIIRLTKKRIALSILLRKC